MEKPCVFVIDSSKGIRKAIADLFGKLGVVHRCHVHKTRKVLGHLPESMHASVNRAMQQAYESTVPDLARRRRVKGFRDMKHLVAALDRRVEQEAVESKKKVA